MRRADREINEASDLEQIIAGCDVCRVAFADKDMPYIVTLNFGYRGGKDPCIYFHCASEGKKIEMIARNNYVCFEMDTDHEIYGGSDGCDWGMRYSSIIGFGKIYIVSDKEEKIEGLNRIMSHYAGEKTFSYNEWVFERTTVLRLDISEITGKRKK